MVLTGSVSMCDPTQKPAQLMRRERLGRLRSAEVGRAKSLVGTITINAASEASEWFRPPGAQ